MLLSSISGSPVIYYLSMSAYISNVLPLESPFLNCGYSLHSYGTIHAKIHVCNIGMNHLYHIYTEPPPINLHINCYIWFGFLKRHQ